MLRTASYFSARLVSENSRIVRCQPMENARRRISWRGVVCRLIKIAIVGTRSPRDPSRRTPSKTIANSTASLKYPGSSAIPNTSSLQQWKLACAVRLNVLIAFARKPSHEATTFSQLARVNHRVELSSLLRYLRTNSTGSLAAHTRVYANLTPSVDWFVLGIDYHWPVVNFVCRVSRCCPGSNSAN